MAYKVDSKWVKPNIITPKNSWPLQRRAHTTVHYKDFLVVFGGGNGQAALNDVWALKISDPDELTWEEWKATGDVPVQKGYHTANLVGSKMLVYGGSDGNHSFSDIHVLDLGKQMQTDSRRLFVAHDPDASGVSILVNHRNHGLDDGTYATPVQSVVAYRYTGRILPIHHRRTRWLVQAGCDW